MPFSFSKLGKFLAFIFQIFFSEILSCSFVWYIFLYFFIFYDSVLVCMLLMKQSPLPLLTSCPGVADASCCSALPNSLLSLKIS